MNSILSPLLRCSNFTKLTRLRLFSDSALPQNPVSFEVDVRGVKDEGEALKVIEGTVKGNPVVLFMKGTANRPQCGFSHRVTQILLNSSLNSPFATVNVLANEEVRAAIKKYSDWPTVPQLYVKGNFIGGCDIVYEMYMNGSFTGLLRENGLYLEEEKKEI